MASLVPVPRLIVNLLLFSSVLEGLSVLPLPAADTSSEHHPQAVLQNSNPEFDADGLPGRLLESLLRSKNVRQARIVLSRTPRHNNDEEARTIWRAACLCVENKYDESIAEFRQVKDMEKAKGYVLYLAAMAFTQAQEFSRAKELCNLAIKRDNCHECYEIRATCFNSEKHYTEAAADYEIAATYSRHHASDFYCEAAQALLKANQPDKALHLIDKAAPLQNASLTGSLLLAKGACLERLGRCSEAAAVLSKGINTQRDGAATTSRFWLVSCLTERAKCYEKLGRKAEAAADRKTIENMSSGLANDLLGK